MAKKWYAYRSDHNGQTISEILNAGHYSEVDSDWIGDFCDEGFWICAIYADKGPVCPACPGSTSNGGYRSNTPYNPLSMNIQSYLIDAATYGVAQPDIPSAKIYVYTRENAIGS